MKANTESTADLSEHGRRILARMDRIPVWSLPSGFLAIIGLGYFFTFYDITDIGFAMPAIAPAFNLNGSEVLFVALAIGLIGYIFGSYFVGTLADKFGRFDTMLLTMILTAIGSFGDAAATGIITLSIWRFVTGMGVGADLNLVSTYIGEFAPPNKRGRISVLTFLVGIIGQAVTPFVALALVPTFTFGWRLLFVIGGIIAVIALSARFKLPESPRWLVLHGRPDKAEGVVAQMEANARKKLGGPCRSRGYKVTASRRASFRQSTCYGSLTRRASPCSSSCGSSGTSVITGSSAMPRPYSRAMV